MHLQQLTTFNHRNLENQTITFCEELNFVSGLNGQGKSNLLEAIFLLGHGKSFRTSTISELVRNTKSEGSVFGTLQRRGVNLELGVAIRNGRRSYSVNGEKVQQLAKYLGNFPCYAFTPDDLQIVKSGPIYRREFFDRSLSMRKSGYLSSLMTYQKALKNKAAVLREKPIDRLGLDSWNEILAEHGASIEEMRSIYTEELSQQAKKIHVEFAPGDGALEIVFRGCLKGALGREIFWSQLEQIREREIAAERPLFGAQRDDYELFIGGKEARSYASQGQSRSIVLSMVIAATQLIETSSEEKIPLLLDDVESELDSIRLNRFFSFLGLSKRQVFLSGTESKRSEDTSNVPGVALHFSVHSGQVSSGEQITQNP
jgi:DNA replication and repair protein RecF